jgi:hypothetical protein
MTRTIFAYVDAQNARKEAVDVSKVKTVSKKKTTKKKKKGSKATKAGEGAGDTAKENDVKGAKVKRKGRKVGKSVRVTVEECVPRVPEASLPIPSLLEDHPILGGDDDSSEEREEGRGEQEKAAVTEDDRRAEIPCKIDGATCSVPLSLYRELRSSTLQYYLASWLSNSECKECRKKSFKDGCRVVHYCCVGYGGKDGMTCDGLVCDSCRPAALVKESEINEEGGRRSRRKVAPKRFDV